MGRRVLVIRTDAVNRYEGTERRYTMRYLSITSSYFHAQPPASGLKIPIRQSQRLLH